MLEQCHNINIIYLVQHCEKLKTENVLKDLHDSLDDHGKSTCPPIILKNSSKTETWTHES